MYPAGDSQKDLGRDGLYPMRRDPRYGGAGDTLVGSNCDPNGGLTEAERALYASLQNASISDRNHHGLNGGHADDGSLSPAEAALYASLKSGSGAASSTATGSSGEFKSIAPGQHPSDGGAYSLQTQENSKTSEYSDSPRLYSIQGSHTGQIASVSSRGTSGSSMGGGASCDLNSCFANEPKGSSRMGVSGSDTGAGISDAEAALYASLGGRDAIAAQFAHLDNEVSHGMNVGSGGPMRSNTGVDPQRVTTDRLPNNSSGFDASNYNSIASTIPPPSYSQHYNHAAAGIPVTDTNPSGQMIAYNSHNPHATHPPSGGLYVDPLAENQLIEDPTPVRYDAFGNPLSREEQIELRRQSQAIIDAHKARKKKVAKVVAPIAGGGAGAVGGAVAGAIIGGVVAGPYGAAGGAAIGAVAGGVVGAGAGGAATNDTVKSLVPVKRVHKYQCGSCALKIEPKVVSSMFFCPQCGNRFCNLCENGRFSVCRDCRGMLLTAGEAGNMQALPSSSQDAENESASGLYESSSAQPAPYVNHNTSKPPEYHYAH